MTPLIFIKISPGVYRHKMPYSGQELHDDEIIVVFENMARDYPADNILRNVPNNQDGPVFAHCQGITLASSCSVSDVQRLPMPSQTWTPQSQSLATPQICPYIIRRDGGQYVVKSRSGGVVQYRHSERAMCQNWITENWRK